MAKPGLDRVDDGVGAEDGRINLEVVEARIVDALLPSPDRVGDRPIARGGHILSFAAGLSCSRRAMISSIGQCTPTNHAGSPASRRTASGKVRSGRE